MLLVIRIYLKESLLHILLERWFLERVFQDMLHEFVHEKQPESDHIK